MSSNSSKIYVNDNHNDVNYEYQYESKLKSESKLNSESKLKSKSETKINVIKSKPNHQNINNKNQLSNNYTKKKITILNKLISFIMLVLFIIVGYLMIKSAIENPNNNKNDVSVTSNTKSTINSDTFIPTNYPSKCPTSAPTEHPTNVPTSAPTEHPTNVPTNIPTNYPTKSPTKETKKKSDYGYP